MIASTLRTRHQAGKLWCQIRIDGKGFGGFVRNLLIDANWAFLYPCIPS
jgi:hypothetical protein